MRRITVLQAAKVLVALCGTWLLLHQVFKSSSVSHRVWVSVNDLSLLVCITFLVIAFHKLERNQRNRTVIGCFVLAVGFFVLEIGPPNTSPERVLWFHSVRLLISRASPFIGLLVLMFTWNPGRLTAILLNPIRWWMNVPLRTSVTVASFLAFFGTSAMAWFGYEGLPRVDDGVANLYQARIFASGHLSLPPPPHPSGFSQFGVIQDPRSCSMFPPAYPLLLALGVLIGLPWLVNPILSGMTVPLVAYIAFVVFGKNNIF